MTIWSFVAGICVLGLVTALTVLRHGHPGPKRERLYETEDGEPCNPFGDLSAGAAASDTSCNNCGTELEVESYAFCVSCGTGALADD